eukprot:2186200-Heterocapsa_arctica.AAC.1
MEHEDKSKHRKDDIYRLGKNLLKTDGNMSDTRGHGNIIQETENIERSRADDDIFDQNNRNREAKQNN